jgi:hypothetical protein
MDACYSTPVDSTIPAAACDLDLGEARLAEQALHEPLKRGRRKPSG